MSRLELECGVVDLVRGEVRREGHIIPLTTKEHELLVFLANRVDQVVPREEAHRAVWGLSSKSESRALDNTIQRLRAKIEIDPCVPKHLLTVYGKGYKLASKEPLDREPWVGRSAELEALREALARGERLISIVGPGGIGKSRMLSRWSATWSSERPTLVDLRGGGDLDQRLGEALGLRLSSGLASARAEAVAEALATKSRVLALDTAEEAAPGTKARVDGWLTSIPTLSVVTSGRVGFGGHTISLGPLAIEDSAALLSELAGVPALDPDVLTLSKRLGGWPLAAVLAARKLSVATPKQITEHLQRVGFARSPLEAAIRWSVEHLSIEHREALAAIHVLPDGFALEAAEAVIGHGALDALDALVSAGLLVRSARFEMPGPVRELTTPLEQPRAQAAARLVRFALDRVVLGPPSLETRRWMVESCDTLVAALAASGPADAAKLAVGLASLFTRVGPVDAWIERLANIPPTPELRLVRGDLMRLRGRSEDARAEWSAASTDPEVGPRARAAIGNLDRTIGRFTEACAALEGAVAELRGVEQGVTLGWLGTAYARAGETARALQTLERAASQLEDLGARRELAVVVANLGVMHLEAGEHAEAMACFAEAREVHELWDDWRNQVICASNLGALHLERGEVDEAEAMLIEGEALARELGERRLAVQLGLNKTLVLVERRCWSEAADNLRRHIRALVAIGAPLEEGIARGHLGICRWFEGDRIDAVSSLERALPLAAPQRQASIRAWLSFVAGQPVAPEEEIGGLLAGGPIDPTRRARSFDYRLAAVATGR